MAESVLTTRERARLDGSSPVANDVGLGAKLGDVQDRVGVLEASSLGSNALQGPAGYVMQVAVLPAQNGTGTTPIAFDADTPAAITGTVDMASPVDLSAVGDGGTFIVNPDDAGADTATLNAAAATSVSGAAPSTDISAEADNALMISVNGSPAVLVELPVAGLDSGAAIATELQTKIQALALVDGLEGYGFEDVTVAYTTVYTITSGVLGTDSSVVVTPAAEASITEELKLGVAAGGVETAGTGDCGNIAAVEIDELITLINGDIAGLTADSAGGYLRISSDTAGVDSSLVLGAGTLNVLLGFTNAAAACGGVGLGLTAMANANYSVMAIITDAAQGAVAALGVAQRTTAGFNLLCSSATSTAPVVMWIGGVPAES